MKKARAYPGFLLMVKCYLSRELFRFDGLIRARTANQLDISHGCFIPGTEPALENTQVAAWAIVVTRPQFIEELAYHVPITQAIERKSPVSHAVFFGQCN